MKNFSQALTIEEATALYTFRGTAHWVDNAHNRAVMATVIDNHLKSLKAAKA